VPAPPHHEGAEKRHDARPCHHEIGMGPERFIYGTDADCHQPHDNAGCHGSVEALRGGSEAGRRRLRDELDGAEMRRAEGEAVKKLHEKEKRDRRIERRHRPAEDGGSGGQHDEADGAEARH